MTGRRSRRGDDGVSSVVAAVLLLALFVSISTVWTVNTLPKWKADNERLHGDQVETTFGRLKADLEALSARDDNGPVTESIRLGAPKVALLQAAPASGSLEWQSGIRVTGSFPNARVLIQDGKPVGRPTQSASGGASTNIQSLDSLELAMSGFSLATGNAIACVRVHVTDSLHYVDGVLTAARKADPAYTCLGDRTPGQCDKAQGEIRFTVITDLTTPETVRPTSLVCQVSPDLTEYQYDAMNPMTGFSTYLSRLKAPLTMTVSTGGNAISATGGSYSGSWTQSDGLGMVAGDGEPSTYALSQTGGRVVFAPRNQGFVQQDVVFEEGAVLLSQGGSRQAVAIDPTFALQVRGTTAYLTCTFVELSGSGSISGVGDAGVRLTREGGSQQVLSGAFTAASPASIQVVSPSAAAWKSFWQSRFLAAGIPGAATISTDSATNPTTATLGLGGGTITSWILDIRETQATATVA